MWIYSDLPLALGVTAVLLFVTYVKRPYQRYIGNRGGLIALAVAALIGSAVCAAVLFIGGTMNDALLAAALVAIYYLCLNVVVLEIGVWFVPPESWAVGAALATPVILAALGFGYAAYRSVAL